MMGAIAAPYTPPGVCLTLAGTAGDRFLFDNFVLPLPTGQITCLLGKSGIGKSTLLKAVAGLLPTPGAAISVPSSPATPIAYATQHPALLPWCTVWENVAFPFRLNPATMPKALQQERTASLLRELELDEALWHRLPHTLSGGQAQRVNLARALVVGAPLLLLDEPFAALDIPTRLRLHETLLPLLRGQTVLWVTHDPLEAVRVAATAHVLGGSPTTIQHTAAYLEPAPRAVNSPWAQAQHVVLLEALMLHAV
jgi:putative hydroxymethylpyrimidine transport system ATP-binding protein